MGSQEVLEGSGSESTAWPRSTALRSSRTTTHTEDRFSRLYTSHHSAIHAFVVRRGHRHDEADDIVADTFLVLWRRLEDAPKDDAVILAWLYVVARRVASGRLRTSRRRHRLIVKYAQSAQEIVDPHDVHDDRRRVRSLCAALLALRPVDRELLLLEAWEGLSPPEIGRVLGCSENAVAIRLHRARKRLALRYSTGVG